MNYKTLISNLKNNKTVTSAILFGSRAKGTQKHDSDYDIAVFLNDYNQKNTRNIERLKTEQFDVIPYNKIPLHVQAEVFKHGKPIFIKDNNNYTKELYLAIKNYQDNQHHYYMLKKYRWVQ